MPTDLANQVAVILSSFQADVDHRSQLWLKTNSAEELRSMELELAQFGRVLADRIAGAFVGDILGAPEFQESTWAAAKASGEYRSGGPREVEITFLGGEKQKFKISYVKRDLRGRRGRRRGTGKRGVGGTGFYPALAALGVLFGVTPALAAEITRQVTDSDSVRSGREALGRRGIDLGHKQTLRIVNHVGQTALAHRTAWLEECIASPPTSKGPLAGKRVFVSTDGGRTRIREQAKAGRRRTKTGHRKYNAPWKEPKLLVIYVVDDEGNIDESFAPVYDGTMGDADAVFRMLLGYLRHLGAHEAKELMFVADGAVWIWDRVAQLAADVGIPAARVTEVVDWYHAVETLHTIAGLPAQWSKGQRKGWVNQARNLLRKGKLDALTAHIRYVAVGRRAKKVLSHLGYFTRNKARMQYHEFKARHVVRGSGAMESAVRRVINMRLKSNAKYWLLENAQAMLLLRSYSKAGRFNDLIAWTYARQVPWWRHETPLLFRVSSSDAEVIELNQHQSQSSRLQQKAA